MAKGGARTNAGRKGYPWRDWFGQPRTVIVRGVDYTCGQGVMWQQIRNEAWRRRLRVSVTDENDYIVIEVHGEIPHTDKVAVAGK